MIFFIPTEGTVTQENDKSQVGQEKIFLVILNHKKKKTWEMLIKCHLQPNDMTTQI